MVPRVWVKPRYYDFDNVGVALLTLFETASTESWMNVFWDIRDFAGTDLQPERDVNMIAAVFMIPFMLVGYMFFVQLFIGVVVNNFETQQGMALLTNEQQRCGEWERDKREDMGRKSCGHKCGALHAPMCKLCLLYTWLHVPVMFTDCFETDGAMSNDSFSCFIPPSSRRRRRRAASALPCTTSSSATATGGSKSSSLAS